ncbi:MAG: permease [Candidatus Woesearchaeota archaeon]
MDDCCSVDTKKISHDQSSHSCCHTKPKPWYKQRIFLVIIITIALLVSSYFIPFLNPFYDAFIEYTEMIWWAILLGLFIGGIIDALIPQEYVTKFLSRKKKRTILFATVFGFLMSACSHGILAIAIALHKKGASIPAVIAFLLAAPWANLTVTILLFGFFGIKALFFILSAIVVAIITGLIFQVLEKKGLIEKSKEIKVDEHFSIRKDLKKRFAERKNKNFSKTFNEIMKSTWSLTKMVLWWMLIGMVIASAARAFVPMNIFDRFFGPTILGIVITLIAATIIEVCSEGSAPMAFEIFRQTGAFGNSFVFLMAGVATDYTEIGLLWSNIGKKTATWLPIITVPQIIILGFVFNALL